MGITKGRAAAACLAIVLNQEELGTLVALVDTLSDESLALLDERWSNEAIVAFLRAKARAGGTGPRPSSEAGGAGPGPSSEAAAAAGGAGPCPGSIADAGVKRRVAGCSKYAAHIKHQQGAATFKVAAVVFGPHHIATAAHGPHEHFKVGSTVKVYVDNDSGAQRRAVDATVEYHPGPGRFPDVMLLKVQEALSAPVIDCCLYPAQPYMLFGQSAQAHADETSVSHGRIAATEADIHGHVRGDIMSGEGDSGGGVFDADTSKLIAMCVGVDPARHKSVMVPVSCVHTLMEMSGTTAQPSSHTTATA